MNTTNLQIEGMSCGHCVRAVTQAIQGVPGVSAVQVDLDSKQAKIEHEGSLDLDAVRAAVVEEGFEVAKD